MLSVLFSIQGLNRSVTAPIQIVRDRVKLLAEESQEPFASFFKELLSNLEMNESGSVQPLALYLSMGDAASRLKPHLARVVFKNMIGVAQAMETHDTPDFDIELRKVAQVIEDEVDSKSMNNSRRVVH